MSPIEGVAGARRGFRNSFVTDTSDENDRVVSSLMRLRMLRKSASI